MTEFPLSPAFILLLGAVLLPFLPGRWRNLFFTVLGAGLLTMVLFLPTATPPPILRVMQYRLIPLQVDGLSRGFGVVFGFVLAAGGIYAYHLRDRGQQCAALLYAAGALGVVFAGDYYSLFFFWELMAISSTVLIWARRDRRSFKAGFRYIIYHALGGGILLAGILSHIHAQAGDILITNLPARNLSGWLILLGVAVNSAIPPLHTWLVDAYPRATITGAIFLNAFTTKTAVYVLIRLFAGWELLIVAGTVMALYGVIYTVITNDIRGILSYHIVSQVGYMVAAVGIGTPLALNGAAAHALANILFKGLLFMAAGAIMAATGESRLTRLGGLFRRLPRVTVFYMIGALSIAGFPLFNGFISKSMILTAATRSHFPAVFLLLNLAAVGTFLSLGLKLPYFAFFHRARPGDLPVREIPRNLHPAMVLMGLACFLQGVFPRLLYFLLPHPVEFHPYTLHHLTEVSQMFGLTFVAFWLFRGMLRAKEYIVLDVDWFFRKPALGARRILVDGTLRLFDLSDRLVMALTRGLISFSQNPMRHVFKTTESDRPYDPDRYRPTVSMLLFGVLLVFLILIAAGPR